MTSAIPFHRPSIGDEEVEGVVRVLRSGWLTTGAETAAFEEEFSEAVQAEHAVAVSSGTAALELALAAFDVAPGDEVVTTPLTFVATVEAILRVGAKTVFADVDPKTGCLDVAAVEARLTERTRAILPVHLAGHPADLGALRELARSRGLVVIDDAAHAFGARAGGLPVGSAADATAFSFYANKNITTGEGGMITLADGPRARRLRRLRLHGLDAGTHERRAGSRVRGARVVELGTKSNLPDLLSVIGRAQLRKSLDFEDRRRVLAARYREALAGVDGLRLPADVDRPGDHHAWHLFIVQWTEGLGGVNRDEAADTLGAMGIGTAVHYPPLHLMEPFQAMGLGRPGEFPVAELRGRESLALPLYPTLGDDEVDRIAEAVVAIAEGGR